MKIFFPFSNTNWETPWKALYVFTVDQRPELTDIWLTLGKCTAKRMSRAEDRSRIVEVARRVMCIFPCTICRPQEEVQLGYFEKNYNTRWFSSQVNQLQHRELEIDAPLDSEGTKKVSHSQRSITYQRKEPFNKLNEISAWGIFIIWNCPKQPSEIPVSQQQKKNQKDIALNLVKTYYCRICWYLAVI